MSSASRGCTSCGSKSLERDDVTGDLVCLACGIIQEFDNFDAQLGGLSGPQGTFVRVGTAGSGTSYSSKQRKVFVAQGIIDGLVFRLGLSGAKSNDVKRMVATITEGEFGMGDWFTILIGACAYIVMRKDKKSLPIAEVASVIGSDIFELGKMVGRVVDFLELRGSEFPEFDIVGLFERAVRNSPSLSRVGRDMVKRMREQGIFLIQCAVKWFLTTGRRPLPLVAAVLVLVAELNGVDLKIEDVAQEVHANVSTSKVRYREFLESLVKVAQVLPWGKDVTVKNVVKNAPLLIQYMERKSMDMPSEKRKKTDVEGIARFDLEDVVNECLRKDVEYGTNDNRAESDYKYFEVKENGRIVMAREDDDVDRMKLSHECLSLMYKEFLNEVGHKKSMERSVFVHGRKTGFEFRACRDWWNGKSELTKKLLLKQILERDVGLDALPPSFVSGCRVYERRREKINAAKERINRIMHPSRTDLDETGDILALDYVHGKKERKRRRVDDIDWEDFIIETLLLHKVKEEEIEKGHYNTLLHLHVFNSGVLAEVPARRA